jgi:hypothetical protein
MDSTASNTRKFGTAFAPSMFWVDSKKKLFYEITQRFVNEAIADSSVNFYNQFTPAVNVLDMRTKQWKQLGYLIDYGWHHLIQTPWGLLVIGNSDNIYLADFENNARLACKEANLTAYRVFFMKDPPQITFYANGYIYLGTVVGNQLDSIPFSVKHFKPIDKPLYREYKSSSFDFNLPELLVSPWFLYPTGILAGVVLGFILLGVFKNNFRQKDSSWKAIFNNSVSPAERVSMLTQTEKGLIELISNSSLKGRKVSIEEVNKVIGVAGKNEPIKRRVRSEIINSVNEKWMIISASREKLIESIKSPEDKRAREYYISTEILASPVFSALLQSEE